MNNVAKALGATESTAELSPKLIVERTPFRTGLNRFQRRNVRVRLVERHRPQDHIEHPSECTPNGRNLGGKHRTHAPGGINIAFPNGDSATERTRLARVGTDPVELVEEIGRAVDVTREVELTRNECEDGDPIAIERKREAKPLDSADTSLDFDAPEHFVSERVHRIDGDCATKRARRVGKVPRIIRYESIRDVGSGEMGRTAQRSRNRLGRTLCDVIPPLERREVPLTREREGAQAERHIVARVPGKNGIRSSDGLGFVANCRECGVPFGECDTETVG